MCQYCDIPPNTPACTCGQTTPLGCNCDPNSGRPNAPGPCPQCVHNPAQNPPAPPPPPPTPTPTPTPNPPIDPNPDPSPDPAPDPSPDPVDDGN